MNEDAELLHRYAAEQSEAAFAELIRRHVDLVYSAALRLVNGDAHRAQDVTQQVFAEFARQAKRLVRHPALVGWLYMTTRRSALRVIRTEQRRSARELEASTMNELLRESTPEPDWEHLRPVLEDAMHELGEQDRHAVLLRFFQNKSLKEVGLALDVGENAARMRVDRALDKLRVVLSRRGVATSASLASVISAHAVQVAPAGLATILTATSFAAGTTTFTLFNVMNATTLKLSISAIVVAGAATALVVQHQAQEKLRSENEGLRQQLAQMESDNQNLSNRLASSGDSQVLNSDQLNELLKLRGENGLLRKQLSSSKAQAQPADHSAQSSTAADPAAQQQQIQIHRMGLAKDLAAAAMLGFSDRHGGQFPTNWDQIASYFDQYERDGLNPGDTVPDTTADFSEMTNKFELTYQGAISNLYNSTNFHDLIVVREEQPWQGPTGKWLKIYGFADGHSEIHAEPPEGFDAYEQNHMLLPVNQ